MTLKAIGGDDFDGGGVAEVEVVESGADSTLVALQPFEKKLSIVFREGFVDGGIGVSVFENADHGCGFVYAVVCSSDVIEGEWW